MIKENPTVIIVEGDTNSVLSSALVGVKLQIPIAHVEAGLRSYDKNMPEEINRIVVDHCSEILFAPTEQAGLNLIHEGIEPNKIFITGNTIVDSTFQNVKLGKDTAKDLYKGDYLVLTLHRAENVDNDERLKGLIEAIDSLGEKIIFPAHPRTVKRIKSIGINQLKNIDIIKPLGYIDFLNLLKNARAALTDSGGIQEETSILNVPCFTLRSTTERPESVEAGGNILVGVDKDDLIKRISTTLKDKKRLNKMIKADNPFGDGRSGERIVEILHDIDNRGNLKIKTPNFTTGIWKRKIIEVDITLEGKMVEELDFEVIRILDGNDEKFPKKDLKLKMGQIVEIIEKP
jgi:UDP-N-acetylglucosamine 2-epimerase (non-hydrolysing)